MALTLDLKFAVAASDLRDAKIFLTFLRRAARKHSVTMTTSASGAEVTLSVPLKEVKNLSLFLQDLILTRGLHYYLCTVSNRRHVASAVVKPIAEKLLERCFNVTYPVLVRKHLLDGLPTGAAGDLAVADSQSYELLFHRLQLKMISGYEFIRDLDDLLTEFMLSQLRHKKGDKSPNFGMLVSRCSQQDILRDKDVCKLFNRVHTLRTRGLHRMEREIPAAEVAEIAQSVYHVFQWLDDYWLAQDEKTVMLSGKRYRRVRYGQEMRYWKRDPPQFPEMVTKESQTSWAEIIRRPCGDCEIVAGELHLDGCDIEVCPRCAGQYLSCECHRDDLYDDDDD
jgi:hypothetical protein